MLDLEASCAAAPGYNEKVMADRVVVSDPEIMNGTPCFEGTRAPFKNLIDYLGTIKHLHGRFFR